MIHSCTHCNITFDTYAALDEHRRTMHQYAVLLRFTNQGGKNILFWVGAWIDSLSYN